MRRAPILAASSRNRLSACCSSCRNTCRVVKMILSLLLALQRRQVPPEPRRVAHELVGRDLEQHDDAGLVELAGAAIDELGAQRRLAGADRAFQQNDVAARNPAREDGIEPAIPVLTRSASGITALSLSVVCWTLVVGLRPASPDSGRPRGPGSAVGVRSTRGTARLSTAERTSHRPYEHQPPVPRGRDVPPVLSSVSV